MRSLFFSIICQIIALVIPNTSMSQEARYGELSHAGIVREHYVYIPPGAGPDTPLVIALHGMGGNAKNLRYGIGLTKAAERFGFAVVYPQGIRLPQGSRHWNAGFDLVPVDDLGYLSELTKSVIRTYNLAKDKVVFAGISVGGYMVYHISCRSDLPLSAIIVVAGTVSGDDWEDCHPKERVSLLHIHGLDDVLVPFAGGANRASEGAPSPAVFEITKSWAQLLEAQHFAPLIQNSEVEEMRFENELTGSEVQLIALPGFGHDWPDQSNGTFNAIDYIVSFLERTVLW